jgi:predicted Zn-dependent protease
MKKSDKDKLSKTYGIFKFKLPTKEDQISAMSLAGESTLFKKVIGMYWENFYDNIPTPDIGDWLMEHKEYGQTFDEYIRGGIIPVQANMDTIYLAPLSCGEKGSLDSGFVNSLLIMCEAFFYGMKVKILEKRIDLMKYEIDIRQYEEGKLQINANQILKYLYKEIPSDGFCLIAFTDKDLYNENDIIKPRNYISKSEKIQINSNNNFCYGLSSLKNRVGVFSFARYDPLFYTNIILQDNPKQQEKLIKYFFILLKRACKVIIKETCHMFGLKNCIFFSCNLNGFNSMEEFDKRPLEICPVCLRKLYTNICLKSMQLEKQRVQNPMIIYDRFVKLRDSLAENFYGIFENEVNWLDARIDSLKNEI